MPETAPPTAGAGASSDETVDAAALPADVWRIIARFAQTVSAVATRHLAAPARTLDEHVQYKLDSNKDEWHDRTHAQNEVDRTQDCLKLLNALRTVSTELRDIVNYSSTRELALKSDACLKMPTDFGTRFGGCETLTIDGCRNVPLTVRGSYTPREGARSVDSLPEEFQQLPRLRSLSLHAMATGLTPWFRDLNLRELYIDYPDGVSQRSWERDPHALPKTLEVLLFNTCVEDASLECVRLLPRLREIRLGSRNMTQSDVVPHWFHELTSLRRFEVYLASVGDWAEELSAMSLESITFQVDQMGEGEIDFCLSLGAMFLQGEVFGAGVGHMPLTRLGESLREIHLDGYDGLTRMPECLLRLPRLQHLDLSGSSDLVELPDSVGQLPLVVLNLCHTGIRTLPASLQTTRTLRILELTFTDLSAFMPSQRDALVLQFCDADERNRRDAILRPLSLAIPDLRFRLHSDDNDDFLEDASMHWWHALCGYDWWDPVFGSPDPPSPDDASF